MRLKVKKILLYSIIFNVIIFNTLTLKTVQAHNRELDIKIDGVTGSTINVKPAIKQLKMLIVKAEKIYSNAVEGSEKGEYPKEAIERFRRTIESVKSYSNSKSSLILAMAYNTLNKAIDQFRFSIIQKDKINNDENKEIRINCTIVGMYNEILLKPKSINIKENTVENILKSNNIKYKLNKDHTIKSINGIVNGIETKDDIYKNHSKWICVVNNKKVQGSIKHVNVKKDDFVMFYYSNGGKIPSYDKNKNAFINIKITVFDIYGNKIMNNNKMLIIKGSNEYFIVKSILNKAGIQNIKYFADKEYIKSGEYPVKIAIDNNITNIKDILKK